MREAVHTHRQNFPNPIDPNGFSPNPHLSPEEERLATGAELVKIARELLADGRPLEARKFIDLALERGGPEVARLATFTEGAEGVAYGRMRLILATAPQARCEALCDLGVLKLRRGDLDGASELFCRASLEHPLNEEAALWFDLIVERRGALDALFNRGALPSLELSTRLSLLLPDATNGYIAPIRASSRIPKEG